MAGRRGGGLDSHPAYVLEGGPLSDIPSIPNRMSLHAANHSPHVMKHRLKEAPTQNLLQREIWSHRRRQAGQTEARRSNNLQPDGRRLPKAVSRGWSKARHLLEHDIKANKANKANQLRKAPVGRVGDCERGVGNVPVSSLGCVCTTLAAGCEWEEEPEHGLVVLALATATATPTVNTSFRI